MGKKGKADKRERREQRGGSGKAARRPPSRKTKAGRMARKFGEGVFRRQEPVRISLDTTAQNLVCSMLCDLRISDVEKERAALVSGKIASETDAGVKESSVTYEDGEDGTSESAGRVWVLDKELRRLQRARDNPAKVLKALVEQDRAAIATGDGTLHKAIEDISGSQQGLMGSRVEAVEMNSPSGILGGSARGQQTLGKRVRLQLCAEGKQANLKLIVVNRKSNVDDLLDKAKQKLKIKKKPVAAYVLGSGLRLIDTLTVPDGTVVSVTSTVDEIKVTDRSSRNSKDQNSGASVAEGEEIKAVAKKEPLRVGSVGAAHLSTSAAGTLHNREVDENETGGGAMAPEWNRAECDVSDREVEIINASLQRKQAELEKSDKYKQMLRQREPLPAYMARDTILKSVANAQVTVISGATGCGKTTQIPQLILEDAYRQGHGARTSIVCTQPRRISAIGVADRVASERDTVPGGRKGRMGATDESSSSVAQGRGERLDDVGYHIRLDKRANPRTTRLLFCTTGILLRRLQTDSCLNGVSHIIVDEAHERDLQTDFLLIILRRLLRRRSDLKIVVMSATLQADLFVSYFAEFGCQDAISIPGRLFPVHTHYMEDIAQFCIRHVPECHVARNYLFEQNKARSRVVPSATASGGGAACRGETRMVAASSPAEASQNALLSPAADAPMPYDMIVSLIRAIIRHEDENKGELVNEHFSSDSEVDKEKPSSSSEYCGRGNRDRCGAIIVFMPGQAEINKLAKLLSSDPEMGSGQDTGGKVWVLPLHASLSSAEQRRVFKSPPPGMRKVVVSTNIAETSITIDDATHVIDSGRVREIRYESNAKVSVLKEVWTSKAAAKQRAGRAGRVQEGNAWRMYSKGMWGDSELGSPAFLPEHSAPEILRTPLEELILQVLLLKLGQPESFLQAALQPPPRSAIVSAVGTLVDIGAVAMTSEAPERNHGASLVASGGVDEVDDDEIVAQDEVSSNGEEEEGTVDSDDHKEFGGNENNEADDQTLQGTPPSSSSATMGLVDVDPNAPNDQGLYLRLTPLGFHLAHMPMDCKIGKMLLYGSIFGLLGPMLSIAASLSCSKQLFQGGQRNQRGVAEAKARLSGSSGSDLIIAALAFQGWVSATDKNGYSREFYLSNQALREMRNLRLQFHSHLVSAGFAEPDSGGSMSARGGSGTSGEARLRSDRMELLRGLCTAGLFPNVVQVAGMDNGKRVLKSRDGSQWWVHPQSVNFSAVHSTGKGPSLRTRHFVFSKRLVTQKPYLLDTTAVSPFSLLLFGGRLQLGVNRSTIVVDRWMAFKTEREDALLVVAIRKEIEHVLLRSVHNPNSESRSASLPVVEAVGRLLECCPKPVS